MKGYKGFDKDFKCRGKQYAENATLENRFCQEVFSRECLSEGIDSQDIERAIETIKAMRI